LSLLLLIFLNQSLKFFHTNPKKFLKSEPKFSKKKEYFFRSNWVQEIKILKFWALKFGNFLGFLSKDWNIKIGLKVKSKEVNQEKSR
jgi:hypothetical protein